MLKQEAEFSRRGSVKGEKDVEDILSILSTCEIDSDLYKDIILTYNLSNYPKMLKQLIESEGQHLQKFFKNPTEIKKRKRVWINKLKRIEKIVMQELAPPHKNL